MFSPFARNLLKPQHFERMDTLMKPIPPVVEDPWGWGYPDLDAFEQRLRELSSKKRSTFQLFLNANQFQPHDISVKFVDGFIVIHAEHDVKPDPHGYICREFTRRCKIPDDVDPATLSSTFNKNGLLVVKGNAKPKNPSPDGEVVIPVEIQVPQIGESGLQTVEMSLLPKETKTLKETVIEIPLVNGAARL